MGAAETNSAEASPATRHSEELRKNWLFVGSPLAGRRAAVQLLLVASCKTNQVEPWAYLRDIFEQLPREAELDKFLPDRWLSSHPEHSWQIADLRAQEGTAKGGL